MATNTESQTYQCPRCGGGVDVAARRCPNESCRTELGFCSYCRKISTFAREGKMLRCSRCEGKVEPCLMRSLGANCNGYAREEGLGRLICDRCRERAGAVVRWGAGVAASSALSAILRPKK